MTLKDKSAIKRYLYHLGPEIISKIKESNTFADFGCAEGQLLELLHEEFGKSKENLYGFDFSEDFIAEAKKSFPNIYRIDFATGKPPEQKFDLVFALDVIEHLENPVKFLEDIAAAMKKNSLFILSTPNIYSLSRFIQGARWFGFKDKTHRVFYGRASLSRLVEKSGLKIIKFKTISDTGFLLYNKIISLTSLGGQILLAAEKKQ
jgi:2-polyprenyl-3-methyl-5-hydroxy-6-metoxy-1,4-benzoquinol methylase